jgi:hypothetical protein
MNQDQLVMEIDDAENLPPQEAKAKKPRKQRTDKGKTRAPYRKKEKA